MARSFYRIVKSDPPTVDDFTPRPLRQSLASDPRLQELALGISVWSTPARAQRAAREFPRLGGYIARMVIPDDAGVRVEKTLGPGHYTIWSNPTDLVGVVMSVVSVDR